MYNYLKNGVTLKAEAMAKVDEFNKVAREYASASVAHQTEKHERKEKIDALIKDEKVEEAKVEQIAFEKFEDEWAETNKAFNLKLYGGKVDNNKVEGVCDLVSDDLYNAYVKYVEEGTTKNYRAEMKAFVESIITEDTIKDGAFNHLFTDIITTMSSVKYNSNRNIADGCAYITTINKRMYKKMLCGAIHDIASNNRTLKVKKNK